ncbi:MAG: 3-hydroxyacyl-ACP dehydratase FabZ [Coprothermobacterota bacterium]|nr:3-hydroxyacyl-ACP dehydratase FabZ [Coprothermobacterota bacterium]
MLDVVQILRIIPHRYPFLFVDRILEFEPGEYAEGIKNVTANEPFFQGHFPSNPIMPGVLLLEAIGQVAAIALLTKDEFKGRSVLLAGVEKARFHRVVRPGDTLNIRAEIVRWGGKIGVCHGTVKVAGETAAEADLLAAIGEPA